MLIIGGGGGGSILQAIQIPIPNLLSIVDGPYVSTKGVTQLSQSH